MRPHFDFAVRKADMSRLDALRLDLATDFWPEAAFSVFRSAMAREDSVADRIPEEILNLARAGARSRGYRCLIPSAVRVRQYDPDAEVMAYLDRFAHRCGLASPRVAAVALVAFWASTAEAWPGAPLIVSDTEGLSV